jgi:signal transduction histidine kinase
MSTAARLIREKKNLIPMNGPVPNRRILVVDDEPEIGAGIKRILNPVTNVTPITRSSRSLNMNTGQSDQRQSEFESEFEVVVVTTPQQALDAVTEALQDNRPFAVGFFDVVLNADIDGIELVKQIFAVDPKLFAVFVTAYHDRTVDTIGSYVGEENREQWDYINKPFTEGEILQKARNATSLWDLHRLKDWQEERLSEAHQLLLQTERQNTVAAVGRSVAHEFGNLLTHIVGNAELAMGSGDLDSVKKFLGVILKASDTATDILKRFRKLHDPGESATPKEIMNLGQVFEEAAELLEFQFRKRYIDIKKSNFEPIVYRGSRHAFVQVFVNVMINSMHAMPEGGEILVQMRTHGGRAEISLRDTGPGIPEDILPKVTEPLFTTKGREGSGLGLAICREIVEIGHGGEFIVQNHDKGGAEILIRLPLGD